MNRRFTAKQCCMRRAMWCSRRSGSRTEAPSHHMYALSSATVCRAFLAPVVACTAGKNPEQEGGRPSYIGKNRIVWKRTASELLTKVRHLTITPKRTILVEAGTSAGFTCRNYSVGERCKRVGAHSPAVSVHAQSSLGATIGLRFPGRGE